MPLTHFSLEQTYLYDMENEFEYPWIHSEPCNTILQAHDVWSCARTKDTSGHMPIFGGGLTGGWYRARERQRVDRHEDLRMGEEKKINVSTSWTWNFGFGTHGFTWFDAWSVMSNLRSFFTTCIPCWITNPNRIHAIHKYIIYITRCTCLKNKYKKSIK